MAISLSRILATFAQERFREVTVYTLVVFSVIAEEHPHGVPQSQLGKFPALLDGSKSSLARHCRLLESLGLISRTTMKDDRRQFNLFLTEQGQTLWEQLK